MKVCHNKVKAPPGLVKLCVEKLIFHHIDELSIHFKIFAACL